MHWWEWVLTIAAVGVASFLGAQAGGAAGEQARIRRDNITKK